MYCPKCGALNPDGARLCSACGQILPDAGFAGAAGLPAGRKTSRLAIAALVLGILSPFTCMLTSLPAIILGAVALVRIGGSKGRLGGLGLAVAGMALPVVLLPIIALGMGIMMPALVRARQLAYRMTCGENLSGLGKAMQVYASDYDGRLPTPSKWCDLLVQYVDVAPETFRCHGHEEGPSTYAMNQYVQDLQGDGPPDMVLLFETWPGWNQVGGPEILATEQHQNDGCNVLFMDGHVEFIPSDALSRLRWTATGPPDNTPPMERLQDMLSR